MKDCTKCLSSHTTIRVNKNAIITADLLKLLNNNVKHDDNI